MIIIHDKKKCSGCEVCKNKCPKNCIEMKEDDEGFLYPFINKEECINCGLCEKVCPILNVDKEEGVKPICYGGYNNDLKIREDSSSGGLFYAIAKSVVDDGGVVYGAAFNGDDLVQHIRVESESELRKLRKSKYIQSEVLDCYKLVEQDLKLSRCVLFTGTPCQVEGLLKYLNKKYDNLYTQDIICHGVSSRKVWKKHIRELDMECNDDVNFRNKQNGWDDFSIRIAKGDKVYQQHHGCDDFMKSFSSNCSIRPSCFDCKFKKIHRLSDITLGDFWGVNQHFPELYDEKGVSLLMVHSRKGEELLENAKKNMVLKEVEYEKAIAWNNAYYKSVSMTKNRIKFFKNLDKYNMHDLCKKYCKSSIKNRVKGKIKKIIKKIIKKGN